MSNHSAKEGCRCVAESLLVGGMLVLTSLAAHAEIRSSKGLHDDGGGVTKTLNIGGKPS